MSAPRLYLATLLLIAPLSLALSTPAAHALSPQDTNDSGSHDSSAAHEEFQITITIKFSDHGKATGEESYMMTASNIANNPSVRDGGRIPMSSGSGGQFQYYDIGTNIDITNFKNSGSLTSMGVKIETNGPLNTSSTDSFDSKEPPVIRSARYSVNPIVIVGKSETIYSSTNSASGRKVEILLLTQKIERK